MTDYVNNASPNIDVTSAAKWQTITERSRTGQDSMAGHSGRTSVNGGHLSLHQRARMYNGDQVIAHQTARNTPLRPRQGIKS